MWWQPDNSTSATWITWNNSISTSTSTSTYSITAGTWNAWTSATVTTNYTTSVMQSASAWVNWNHPTPQRAYAKPIPETPQEKRARQLREAADRERWAREQREAAARAEAQRAMRRVAIVKADRLLESVLSDVQREQLRRDEGFLVVGKSGKLYRVRKGRSINVDEIARDTGAVVRTLCAHPAMDVPDGDTMAAQKLMLECDEESFVRIANIHAARGPLVRSEAIAAILETQS